MPKSILKIDSFEGGINSNTDAKDIDNNQVSNAQDVYFGKKGQIGNLGIAKMSNDVASLPKTVTEGYGLGHFNTNYSFGTPSSGTYWNPPTITDGTNGEEPWFLINTTDFYPHVMSSNAGGSNPNTWDGNFQPKYVCENWGLRIHIGSDPYGSPDISFPKSDDNGSATVDGDAISYRIIDDGTNKWFGLLPQNTLCDFTDTEGVEHIVDYDYWFYSQNYEDQGMQWNYAMAALEHGGSSEEAQGHMGGMAAGETASGYSWNAQSNLLKALAGMIAKVDNMTVNLLGAKDLYTGIWVSVSRNQYNDYTPSNKYIWVEYRHYNDETITVLPYYEQNDMLTIKPINKIGHYTKPIDSPPFYQDKYGTHDFNFLNIPTVFDTGHSAYNDASLQIQTNHTNNSAVTNLCSEGYKHANAPNGGNVFCHTPKLTRRIMPGKDSTAHSYHIELANSASSTATVSGETYELKLISANTADTGVTASRAYASPDDDTIIEVIDDLVTDFTPTYGSDKVTNGAFAADSNWFTGTGWAIDGVATCSSGASGILSNSTALTSGLSTDTYYRVKFDVTTYTSGTLYVDLGDNTGGNKQSTNIELANQIFIIKTPGTLAGSLVRFYGGTFRGSIDNVSVEEVTAGVGGMSVARDGNAIAITTSGAGQNNSFTVEPSITRTTALPMANTPTQGIVLIDSNSDMYVLDTSYNLWIDEFNHTSASNTQLYWADTGAKPQFFSDNGVLRFSDTDFSHTNNDPAWFGYVSKDDLFNQAGGNTDPYDIHGWFVKDQAKVFNTTASNWVHTADWSDSPAASPNSKIDIKIAATGSAGEWTGENYKFHLTALFDDDSESLPQIDTDYLTFKDGSGNYYLTVASTNSVTFECTIDPVGASGFSFDERMKGFRIYFSKQSEGYGNYHELGTIDFKKGFVRADGEGTTAWTASGSSNSDAQIATVTIHNEYLGNTYETNTGYSALNTLSHVKWKTATVVKNRTWVGNVRYTNEMGGVESYPHKLFASPVLKFDTFLVPDGAVDFGILEGDEIVKLDNFSDRVLVFTQTNLLVVNVSTLREEFLEETHRWKGISSPNHAVHTTFGVVWANEFSVYKYDGDSVVDLMMNQTGDFEGNRNIARSAWSSFFASNSLVIYEPNKNQIIIKRGTLGTSDQNNGDVYIFDLDTESWSFGKNRFVTTSGVDSPKDTNTITLKDGSVYMINGRSQFFNSYADFGEIDSGGQTLL